MLGTKKLIDDEIAVFGKDYIKPLPDGTDLKRIFTKPNNDAEITDIIRTNINEDLNDINRISRIEITSVDLAEKYAIVTSDISTSCWGSLGHDSNYQIFDLDTNKIIHDSGLIGYGSNHEVHPQAEHRNYTNISILSEEDNKLRFRTDSKILSRIKEYDITTKQTKNIETLDLVKKKSIEKFSELLSKGFSNLNDEQIKDFFIKLELIKMYKADEKLSERIEPTVRPPIKSYTRKIDDKNILAITFKPLDEYILDHAYDISNTCDAHLLIEDKGVLEIGTGLNLYGSAHEETDDLEILSANLEPKDKDKIKIKFQLNYQENINRTITEDKLFGKVLCDPSGELEKNKNFGKGVSSFFRNLERTNIEKQLDLNNIKTEKDFYKDYKCLLKYYK